ncbi:MAG: ABC transporter ATP-binding protein, partial [Alphaproteobacteria bacterium]|nr:ABC transporter ATP-binding protein [Alphaproteobacteria bacterium]
MLELEDLSVALGGREVLAGVSLKLARGELVGIMGPNGSGKSTLMRAAAGLAPPSAGRIALDGKPLAAWRREDLARELAYLPQGGQAHWPLSVRALVSLG